MTQRNGRLITAQALAEELSESSETVRRHTRRGDYKDFAVNIGTPARPRWRYDTHALDRWITTRRRGQ